MVQINKILVINTGSSSIKFQLFATKPSNPFSMIASGLVERIGIKNSCLTIKVIKEQKEHKEQFQHDIADHRIGAQLIIEKLKTFNVITDFAEISGIGHRIVHGGEKFTKSIIIDERVLADIKDCIKLAPLHNPAALKGYEAFKTLIPNAPHVAVFDTSFHTTLPATNYLYSVPYQWYQDYQVRRYGFHGISYRYILRKLSEIKNCATTKINAIVCHLGNGASICAIKNGQSYNTTMGLTPLDGLIMGTRSGIIDPSIPGYICDITKVSQSPLSIADVTDILNKNSGLVGISGVSSDLRDVIKVMTDPKAVNHQNAKIAIKMFVQRIASFIVQYVNELANQVDALVFTAGIGENSDLIRQLVIDEIKILQLRIDQKSNQSNYEDSQLISDKTSVIPIYKIRTDEEIMICEDTYQLISN